MKIAALSNAASLHRSTLEAPIAERPVWAGSLATTQGMPKVPAVHLTPRQLEVLSLLCEGLPNKLICRQLNISTGTVKIHIGSILRELGVTSRLQAVVAAHRCGLVGAAEGPRALAN